MTEFLATARAIWNVYLAKGPGRVDAELAQQLRQNWEAMEAWRQQNAQSALLVSAERVLQLCSRCVERSEGLCFVTGEAGLVPRQDLHLQMENALEQLRQANL